MDNDIVLIDPKENEILSKEEKEKAVENSKKEVATDDDFFAKYSQVEPTIVNTQPTEKETVHPVNEQPITDDKPKQRKPRQQRKKFFKGQFLSGALFIVMIDMIVPVALSLLNDVFDKKTKVRVNDLQLSKEQREQLAPIADEAMKELEITANPFVVLGLVSVGMYGSNFMAAKMGLKQE